ncbi:MAG: response regulator transcription factor [Anaerolineae bacterium]
MNAIPDTPIRVLVVDDHLIVREGLSLILETVEGIEQAGEAADGAEALRLCAELRPDVVLMDLRMPGMDGLTAIRRLAATQPEIAVIILTTYDEDELMLQGLQASARGFLLKDTSRAALLDAIHAAARGQTLLSPAVMQRILAHAAAPASAAGPLDLTERELEVLRAAAQGQRSKEDRGRSGHHRAHRQSPPGQHLQQVRRRTRGRPPSPWPRRRGCWGSELERSCPLDRL